MLRSRIAPVLLLRDGGLVKTKGFKSPRYLGDPLNAIAVFNEYKVDEIIVLDISKGTIDFDLIEAMVKLCRMPLSYGGLIRNEDQAKRLYNIGVEKLIFRTIFIESPKILENIISWVGVQSVAICLDIIESGFLNKKYHVVDGNGKSVMLLEEALLKLKSMEIGELVIQDKLADGSRNGMDQNLIDFVLQFELFNPMTFIGGIKSHEEAILLSKRYRPIGIGVGSAFVFKGKLDAILLSYPDRKNNEE